MGGFAAAGCTWMGRTALPFPAPAAVPLPHHLAQPTRPPAAPQVPPAAGFDMLLSRDALQHLPCAAVVASLKNLAASGARLLLLGSYNGNNNTDIRTASAAGYFGINLREPPYSLVPKAVYDEKTPDPKWPSKLLLLFEAAELGKADFPAMAAGCDGSSSSSSSAVGGAAGAAAAGGTATAAAGR